MNKLLAALALTLLSNAALADGFAPWQSRAVRPDTASDAAMVMPTGFAPWRDRDSAPDAAGSDTRFVAMPSVFRPWS
jgi:hypothetical protein